MVIQNICLSDFRNLTQVNLDLVQGINVFYGDNAQGKTNLLEAIYLCATGRSRRTKNEGQIIQFEKQESHIRLILQRDAYKKRIDVHLRRGQKKGIAVDGVPVKKYSELFGTLYAIFFSPEDLNLVKAGPAERRRFLDLEMCQLSGVYYYDLQQYHKILKQRNNLLRTLKQNRKQMDTLPAWDIQLAEYGKRLILARKAFIDALGVLASQSHKSMTGGDEKLKLAYRPDAKADELLQKLSEGAQRDIAYGLTLNGPHKDDMDFLINGVSARLYGSQGQQRTAALSVKLAQLAYVKQKTGEQPVLLLDDVLSELDDKRQRYLLESISGMQTLISCTGAERSLEKSLHADAFYFVENGIIIHQKNSEKGKQ